MNRSLDTYLLKLDKWIDAETCRNTVAMLDATSWKPHTYVLADGETQSVSGEQELDVTYRADPALNTAIMKKMAAAVEFYAVRLQFPWFGALRQHSTVRYNRYGAGQLMLEHCDHIQSLFDGREKGIPILSCLTLLNDDYEGGEFVLWGDEIIPMQTGTTIVFPSNFMFPHRVDLVTSGLRYSCISWAW